MTSPYNDRIIAVIDERIRKALARPHEVGVVSSADPARLRAMVVFDTATNATPVKLAGHVWPIAGDRVLLTQHYKDWYVIAVTNRITGANAEGVNLALPTGSTVVTTVTNLPGDPSFTFIKRWDSTPLLLCGGSTAYTSATASMGFYFGLTVLGAQTTYLIWELESPPSVRFGTNAVRILPDAAAPTAVPVGIYTVNLMWARTSGAGTVATNAGDDQASGYLLELGV